MLNITRVDHLGIRISDLERSREFYERLGFRFVRDAGYSDGHPVIMRHPGGVVVNLLGPSTKDTGTNILMDVDAKYSGYPCGVARRVHRSGHSRPGRDGHRNYRRSLPFHRRHGIHVHP